MMKQLQKLDKSLVLPIAVLPVAGILSGISCALCPMVVQGGEIVDAIPMIGYFLTQVALALTDSTIIALLFTVGAAVGVSDDHDDTAGLADLVSWLMITHLLAPGVIRTLAGLADGSIQLIAFGKTRNALIDIIAGVIGSTCYSKFKDTKLPDQLALFSDKHYVTITTVFVSIVAAAILPSVWPVTFSGLTSLGEAIVGLDVAGAGPYAFLNRLLVPFGLHHALNNVFWFDIIGLGDLTSFQAGKTSADISWSPGMYMSGFFLCTMFGASGTALVMVHTAKSSKKKVAIGIVAPAALCTFIYDVTGLFGFAFMFMAPVLYLVYIILYGIFTMTTVALGFRAGFFFSAGATDLLFPAAFPAAAKTWLIIPLGIAAFTVFYIVFRFMITKFDLKTLGREDNDEGETTVKLANNDFTAVAAAVLEGVGGKRNVTSIDNCATRLRLEIKNYTKADDKKIKSAGVADVIRSNKTTVQAIVGTQVQFMADEFKKLCK